MRMSSIWLRCIDVHQQYCERHIYDGSIARCSCCTIAMTKLHSDVSPAHSGSTARGSAIAGHDRGDVDVEKDIPHSDAHGPAKADEADPHAAATTLVDEATLFASPLPITGERKTTTRKELWSW